MIKRLSCFFFGLSSSLTFAQGTVFTVEADTSVILNPCIPALDGETFLHVDEDVSNLTIEVVDSESVSIALYDAADELEDVAAPGTGVWTTPTASNVRVSPDGRSLDCTELQFADAVFDDGEIYSLRIGDGGATIMDYTAQVFFVADSTEAQADVTAALEAEGLDHLFAAAISGSDVTDNSALARLVSLSATADWDDFDNTTDSLQALRDNAGTNGAALTGVPWNSDWDPEVESEVLDVVEDLTDGTTPVWVGGFWSDGDGFCQITDVSESLDQITEFTCTDE